MQIFSSLLRPKNNSKRQTRRRQQSSYFPQPSPSSHHPHTNRYLDDPADHYEPQDGNGFEEEVEEEEEDGQIDEEQSEEDGQDYLETVPLLPIFSSAHLDALPVYNLTHSIRLLIVTRCETTLSWDQLRSPQISQFLVKPIQQQIRSSHFSRATLYALVANCLQFNKEGQTNPGNAGVCRTRGLMSELLAVRLLKEFTIRELIDALSYDFDPLHGMTPLPESRGIQRRWTSTGRDASFRPGSARTSTLEVAIRAQAKRFLAHPLVVQHLEAIWAGAVVFHSSSDSLHRLPIKPPSTQARHIGATHPPGEASPDERREVRRPSGEMVRRSVSLYNPNESSLFKLSRLRVPRYRQAFSTLSFAILLGLFLAVLIERSLDITVLEVIFWFWSAGFMLDEIVGFSEQGFGLYIMSVWNSFDIGILLFFFAYYVLRLYGIIMADDQKQVVKDMAYDTLATTAVLLFPRLFSLLDHYRYFSQLLIAFRLMMQDLAAILVLIAITCSGFFVAFTLSFGRSDYDSASVAYALFQILMGYTPAAWEVWGDYNVLGKIILTMFLIICHFLVVTILITVLTNSFMAIVKNANEEHQFLFAVNVLSMVKSDALFSYIAPSNIIGWIFSPLRYVIPFRQYVRVNRIVIKLTHFPILFLIFAYERLWLSHFAYEPAELIERSGRDRGRLATFSLANIQDPFAPSLRLREPSVTTRYKDRALEEVFRRPYRGGSATHKSGDAEDRPTTAVDNWMNTIGDITSPPIEQSRSVLEQLEVKRPQLHRSATSLAISSKRRSVSRVAASDIDDRLSRSTRPPPRTFQDSTDLIVLESNELRQVTDDDGDNELVTNDEDDIDRSLSSQLGEAGVFWPDNFGKRKSTSNSAIDLFKTVQSSEGTARPSYLTPQFMRGHDRQTSVNTIVFNPIEEHSSSSSRHGSPRPPKPRNRPRSGLESGLVSGVQSGRQTPKRTSNAVGLGPRPRPILPTRGVFQSTPNVARFKEFQSRRRDPSYDNIALDLASDIGDNRHIVGEESNQTYGGLVTGSYNTQMDFAASMRRKQRREQVEHAEETKMMSRMVLARMNTLEEGFKDILKEVKEWRNASSRANSDAGGRIDGGGPGSSRPLRKHDERQREERRPETQTVSPLRVSQSLDQQQLPSQSSVDGPSH